GFWASIGCAVRQLPLVGQVLVAELFAGFHGDRVMIIRAPTRTPSPHRVRRVKVQALVAPNSQNCESELRQESHQATHSIRSRLPGERVFGRAKNQFAMCKVPLASPSRESPLGHTRLLARGLRVDK